MDKILILFLSCLVLNGGNCAPAKYLQGNEPQRLKLLSIFDKFKLQMPMSCLLCKSIAGVAQSMAASGHGEEYLYDVSVFICDTLKIEDKGMCMQFCKEFKDVVWNVFFVNTILNSDDICGWIFHGKCGTPQVFFPSWNVSLPEKSSSDEHSEDISFPDKPHGDALKVIQITDTHLDLDYEEGSRVNCSRPLCCRKTDGKAEHGEVAAPRWGYPGNCDSNINLVQSMFEHMSSKHEPDYIIWTGDVPAHNIWNQSREDQSQSINESSSFFTKYFPNKKVFPCVGNHEGVPVNNFPPPFVTGELAGNWLWDTLADVWSQWLPEDTQETIKKGGYYTTLIKKGVRIISLNTNFGNPDNFWLFIRSVDPAQQLQWLVDVLQKAEQDGEKVHIIGHIPPNGLLKWWSYNYYRVVDRYHEIIKAQFFGHTHHDEFRIFYDMKTYTKPINVAYVAPSVTTYSNLNPGYRVYDVDGAHANSSWHVVDHATYFFDLPSINKGAEPVWQLEYTAKNFYKMKDLSPTSWDQLVNKMENDDSLFHQFYMAYYKQRMKGTCTGLCKKNFLCVMKTAMAHGFHNFCEFEKPHHYSGLINWIKETYNKC